MPRIVRRLIEQITITTWTVAWVEASPPPGEAKPPHVIDSQTLPVPAPDPDETLPSAPGEDSPTED